MTPVSKKNSLNALQLLQVVVFSLLLLYFGRTLFVPLSFAVLISFVLYPFCRWLERHKIPRVPAIVLSLLLLTVFAGLIVALLVRQFIRFGREWPHLKGKLLQAIEQFKTSLAAQFDISLQQQADWLESVLLNGFSNLFPLLQDALYFSTVSVVLLLLIPFYVALILYYRDLWMAALSKMVSEKWQPQIKTLLSNAITTYYRFIQGMVIVYVAVGVLNSLGLWIIGIPHPILFGAIASLLTFIPYIGISIGALLPITVAWITYDSVLYPIGVVIVFTFVQYLEAHVIFPVAVSYRLQVNTLVTLLAIMAGGILWGAAGMILFVPFLAIFKLIADEVEALEPIAIALGGTPKAR